MANLNQNIFVFFIIIACSIAALLPMHACKGN